MSKTTQKPTKTMVETVNECFSTLLQVALLIGYDNGMVNRNEPKDDFVQKVASVFGHVSLIDLIKLEAFLKTLNNIQLNIIATGEESKSKALMANAPSPMFAENLFNQIFDGE